MLEIRETYINETRGHRIGETDWYEPFTDDMGALFRSLQREYGGCVSRVYRDVKGALPLTVGWVFNRRERYEDDERATYLRAVWVEYRDLERDAAKADALRAQVFCA